MENELKTIEKTSSLENMDNIFAHDALAHFNKNIFPGIKERFFGVPKKVEETKKTIRNLFGKKSKSIAKAEEKMTNEDEINMYQLFGAEIAKGIFEFVVGNNTNDLKRINLFLEVMYLEMTNSAYMNSRLDFNNCAKMYEGNNEKDKAGIIHKSLKLCDQKFYKGLTTITFTKDNLIFENGYGTTIQSKEDFFKKEEKK
ncbi:MAG: hypothetical protein NT085_05395 [candidate division SR1 bacterium]|nr:hypothetical protein [candidate division SR1 bacterium]